MIKPIVRKLPPFCVSAVLATLATTASAQTTYEWVGTTTGATNQLWQNSPVLWEDLTNLLDPAANPPGSNLGGAATDNVIIRNTRPTTGAGAQQTEQVRLTTNAGTIGSLTIGGYKGATGGGGTAPPATGNWTTQFDLRNNAGALIVTGDVTLGSVDVDRARAGQIVQLANNSSSLTILGNIVDNGGDNGNRIIIRGNNQQFSLAGNIGTASGTGSASGRRQIDLRIEADDNAGNDIILATGNQILAVEDFWVGERFNQNANGSYTLDNGNIVEAFSVRVGALGGNTANGAARTATGTLIINDANSRLDVFGSDGNGENGNLDVGAALGNYSQAQTATGTLTVNSGEISATNFLRLGLVGTGGATPVADTNSATGNVTFDTVGVTHVIGRVDGTGANANMAAGGIDVGREGDNSVLTIQNGTVSSLGRVYISGDATNGQDRGAGFASDGTTLAQNIVNVNSGGTLRVNDVNPDAPLVWTNDGTTVRNKGVALGGGTLEVGRDGAGTLNVNGGTLVVGRGNLVLGQSSGNVDGLVDIDGDGTNDDIVFNTAAGVSAGGDSFDLRNRKGTLTSVLTYTAASGDFIEVGAADGDGAKNYRLTQQAVDKLVADGTLYNQSRGTVNITNGATVTIGGTYTATAGDPDPTPNVDINFNDGGGDMIIAGAGTTVDVARNFNMGVTGPGNARNTLTIQDGAALTVGATSPAGVGDFNGQASDITIGGTVSLSVMDDLNLNNSAELFFDFQGGASGSITDFGIAVGDDVVLNNAELTFLNAATALGTYGGDILLIDLVTGGGSGGDITGTFGTVTGLDGTAYELTYDFGGVGDIGLILIPEPSTIASLALGLGFLAGRRRRS